MRLNRIKTLSQFRGLPPGFEIKFYTDLKKERNIEPICFIGLNGSGKSNLLEAIAEIFYYLETYHKAEKKDIDNYKTSFGFEIEYYISRLSFEMAKIPWKELSAIWNELNTETLIYIEKKPNEFPNTFATIGSKQVQLKNNDNNRNAAILPSRIIGYSSGMNELLSNPFIKIDFQYFEELNQKRQEENRNSTLEMNRLFYLNYDSNKFITVANFLFDAKDFEKSDFTVDSSTAIDFGGINLELVKKELKIKDLKSFSVKISISKNKNVKNYLPSELNITIEDFKKCATFFEEEFKESKNDDTWNISFFFWVNKATKKAFRKYFTTSYNLFRKLYFFQLLNTQLISSDTRKIIKESKSGSRNNLSDMLPKFEVDRLIFSLNEIAFKKKNVKEEIAYKKLSDGEHQILQVLGSLLIMDTEGALFIFDEPETHFNPDWRSKFVDILNESLKNYNRVQEVILTTHSPFVVSDCIQEKVFIFGRNEKGIIKMPVNPEINTFGTSTSIITEKIFGKIETISELSIKEIKRIKQLPLKTLDDIQKAKEESRKLGESVEKVLLFRELILKEEELKKNA